MVRGLTFLSLGPLTCTRVDRESDTVILNYEVNGSVRSFAYCSRI